MESPAGQPAPDGQEFSLRLLVERCETSYGLDLLDACLAWTKRTYLRSILELEFHRAGRAENVGGSGSGRSSKLFSCSYNVLMPSQGQPQISKCEFLYNRWPVITHCEHMSAHLYKPLMNLIRC